MESSRDSDSPVQSVSDSDFRDMEDIVRLLSSLSKQPQPYCFGQTKNSTVSLPFPLRAYVLTLYQPTKLSNMMKAIINTFRQIHQI